MLRNQTNPIDIKELDFHVPKYRHECKYPEKNWKNEFHLGFKWCKNSCILHSLPILCPHYVIPGGLISQEEGTRLSPNGPSRESNRTNQYVHFGRKKKRFGHNSWCHEAEKT